MLRWYEEIRKYEELVKQLTNKKEKEEIVKFLGMLTEKLEKLEERIVKLADLAVITGIKVIPTASVKVIIDGKEYVAAETGVGPVDAAIKAIQKITHNLANVRLREYRLEALTGGSDAVAEVVIKVEDKYGNVVSARGAREDIVMASVEAMIEGINKILLKSKRQKTQPS